MWKEIKNNLKKKLTVVIGELGKGTMGGNNVTEVKTERPKGKVLGQRENNKTLLHTITQIPLITSIILRSGHWVSLLCIHEPTAAQGERERVGCLLSLYIHYSNNV